MNHCKGGGCEKLTVLQEVGGLWEEGAPSLQGPSVSGGQVSRWPENPKVILPWPLLSGMYSEVSANPCCMPAGRRLGWSKDKLPWKYSGLCLLHSQATLGLGVERECSSDPSRSWLPSVTRWAPEVAEPLVGVYPFVCTHVYRQTSRHMQPR